LGDFGILLVLLLILVLENKREIEDEKEDEDEDDGIVTQSQWQCTPALSQRERENYRQSVGESEARRVFESRG
jgi:hypothetical protein